MIRERVAESVYTFTSEMYASVNAGAVIGPTWSVLIDTLPFPEETEQIRDFIENDLENEVRFIIYTHYHADNVYGACMFPGATILGHAKTLELLQNRGQAGLERAKAENRSLQDVEIILPEFVFQEGVLGINMEERTLELVSLPGHSPDGIGVLYKEERVLFAGDVMMSVPYFVDGSFDELNDSLKRLTKMKLDSLVQGHGDVILRGEVSTVAKENLSYLKCLAKGVRKAARRKDPLELLYDVDIEECGKSRIMLNGLAEELHRRNLEALLVQLYPDKSHLLV